MDKEGTCTLQELNNMQLRISSLFNDLIKEKNDYKQKSENLNKKLEQVCEEAQNLKNETGFLKMENEALRSICEDMSKVIIRGIRIFRILDLSVGNLTKEDKIALETLKTVFLEFNTKIENFRASQRALLEKKEQQKVGQTQKEIQLELEELNDLDIFTDFFSDEGFDKNSSKKDCGVKNITNKLPNSILQNTHEMMQKSMESISGNENKTKPDLLNTILNANIFRPLHCLHQTSQTENNRICKSPVFKDFGGRKNQSWFDEEKSNVSSTSEPIKWISEKFLEKYSDFTESQETSPIPDKEESPSKRNEDKKELKIFPSGVSPMLKKSNNIEAEISISGVKKLRQTLLNMDCYKKKESENMENENSENYKTYLEDDEVIIESPKKKNQVLEDIKNKKSGKSNVVPFITPPQTSDIDLDETYVSSSVVRKCNMTKKHELEKEIEYQTPLKRPAREKSPEYDSVPFIYKHEPVRKKKERMKLPGHACAECNKYYENEFKDIDTQDRKKILNKCSRHRDKNSPSLDDTPLGFWKPYLTNTTINS